MLAKPDEAAALRAHRSALSTKHLPTRDGNGFRRLILLLTASGVRAGRAACSDVCWQPTGPRSADGRAAVCSSAACHVLICISNEQSAGCSSVWAWSLITSNAGKLVAVHNGGGRVVWAADFGRHANGVHTKATAQLLPWRSSHDVQHAPEVTRWPGCETQGCSSSGGRQQAA